VQMCPQMLGAVDLLLGLPHAEVLEPAWLREQVHVELSRSVRMHNGEG
jgi:hypothetical protein